MVKVRIKGGTPEEGATLCVTCSWGLVRRGFGAAEEEIVCRATTPAGRVPFRIGECSAYTDSRLPNLYSMEKDRLGLVDQVRRTQHGLCYRRPFPRTRR
jgi:hypothetical protein